MTSLQSPCTLIRNFSVPGTVMTTGVLRRLRLVQIAGAKHGKAGYYPDGEFSSDADWCNGIGIDIQSLEEALELDSGEVMDLYMQAHSAFFRDGTINPGDRDGCGYGMRSSAGCYDFTFGAYGTTCISVWANSCEDALELAAEELARIAPGHLISPEEEKEALAEACAERGINPEDIDWSDLRGVDAEAVEAAEADTTYTESGRLRSWEWYVDGPFDCGPKNR